MSNQLLINSDFTDGATGWSATGGFGTYSYTSSNLIAIQDGIVYFTFVRRTLSQIVEVADIIQETDSFSCVLNIKHRQKGDAQEYTQADVYNFGVIFKNSSGGVVINKRNPASGDALAPQEYTDVNLELLRSETPNFNDISSIEVNVTGLDSGYWNGNHGPMVNYISLYATSGGGEEGGGGGGGGGNNIKKHKFNNNLKLNRGLYKRFWNIYRDIRNL